MALKKNGGRTWNSQRDQLVPEPGNMTPDSLSTISGSPTNSLVSESMTMFTNLFIPARKNDLINFLYFNKKIWQPIK